MFKRGDKPCDSVAKKNAEVLPWYRKPSYKGKMSEEEKRILDLFRMKEKHPAATIDDLPEEVASYINRIEFELYDHLKQDKLMQNCLAVSAVAAVLLYLSYFGLPDITILGSYIAGTVMLIFPWFVYNSEFEKARCGPYAIGT